MPLLATWLRAHDEALFARFFPADPAFQVANARTAPADVGIADGLLISGGPDIAPEFHAEPPANLSLIRDAEPERDRWEFAALRTALDRGVPIFCVCKGMQVLNVGLGGTLHLHVEGHDAPEQRDRNEQALRHAVGAVHRFPAVNSSHHQAVDRLAPGLTVEAWSAGDDVIEQVRLRDYPWALGVQYHPERDLLYASLFADFVGQVQAAAGSRHH